ncbi:MAG: glycosyltransferase family 39 protein [Lentimicrobiaceae bacterium]|nr:glycosyltransferase family 39 protein [Lentimicrobiaceae bacterium]MCO5265303.1 glycosyltransferase family 39 protein [Lentimicrobium sp.]
MKLPEHLTSLLKSKLNNYWLSVIAILIVAAALRLTGLNFSYSNDELSALLRVRYSSFSELVSKGFYVDGHPGGIQVFLYYWVKLFGMSETAVRLPFALGGVLATFMAIRLFTRWFNPAAGLLTGAFIAFLQFPLLYSQIARPYGSGLLFSLIMTWYWTKLLFDEKPLKRDALAYALAAAACMYNHYFSFLLALIIGITGLFYLKKDRIIHYLLAGLLAAALFSPHIYITLNHLSIGGVGQWLDKPETAWLFKHIFYVFNDSIIMLLIVAVSMAVLFLFSGQFIKPTKFHLFALLFFILPFLVGFFYSRYVNPVLQHSVLIFSFPFFLALLFSFTEKISARRLNQLVLVVLISGTSQTIAGNNYYTSQHFGEFRGIAQTIAGWNQQFGQDKITRAISVNNPWYIDYYLLQTPQGKTTFEQYDNRGGTYLDSLSTILNQCRTEYFMYAWTKPVPLEIKDMIQARFPCILSDTNFGGLSEATLYQRKHDLCHGPKADTLFRVTKQQNKDLPDNYLILDSLEYSPGYEGIPADLPIPTGIQLVASAEVFASNPQNESVLVVSFHNDAGETVHYLGARFNLFCLPGSWGQVRQTIWLPSSALLHNRMKVYVWNKNREKLTIRNLSITAEAPVGKN